MGLAGVLLQYLFQQDPPPPPPSPNLVFDSDELLALN